MTGQTEKLKGMLDEIEKGAVEEGNMDAVLEAMFAAESNDNGKSPVSKKKQPSAPTQPPIPNKSSTEWKEDAKRLKNEGNISQTRLALGHYKKALALEAQAAEMTQRTELCQTIRNEIRTAKEQIVYFAFYCRFVDRQLGGEQLAFWRDYVNRCHTAAEAIEKDGIAALNVHRTDEGRGQLIRDTDLSFVTNGNKDAQLLENKLELSILSVINLQDNRYLTKALRKEKVARQAAPENNNTSSTKSSSSTTASSTSASSTPPPIRLDVIIQLPANHEHDTEDTTMLTFNTKSSTLDTTTITTTTT